MARLGLLIIENQPALGDEIAVEVVVVVARLSGADVAFVVLAGVIGILPLAPAVFVLELLRHVPFLDRRVHGAEHHAGALRFEGDDSAPLDRAQPRAVALSRGGTRHPQGSQYYENCC